MKNIIICFFVFLSSCVYSQCPIKAAAWPSSIFCGDTASLSALHSTVEPLNINFNKGVIDSLGFATYNAIVVDSLNTTYDCFGVPPEGSHFLFMSTSSDTPRYIQTLPINLLVEKSVGGTICFQMKYGMQNGLGDKDNMCEGLDWITEGVYLEYSININTWITIKYWDPNPNGWSFVNGIFTGGTDSNLTKWNTYCLKLPEESFTSKTRFRWIQKDCSGAGYDAWAIDDISIVLDIEGYKYDWTHDGLPPNITSETPLVTPISDTTYTVFYTNGTTSCSTDVKVNVLPPRDIKTTSDECLCSHLYIPNAFTPNGDGLNDIFMPITFNVIEYEMEIYNRYGNIIYSTENHDEGWNGSIYNVGAIQQQDVYLYLIKIRNFDKKLHFYMGQILIIK